MVSSASTGDLSNLFGDPSLTQVERAIAELRAGRPVLLADEGRYFLISGAETASADLIAAMGEISGSAVKLVLSPARLRGLGLAEADAPMSIAAGSLDVDRIASLIAQPDAALEESPVPAGAAECSALQLARHALLLPAVLMAPLAADAAPPLALLVQAEAIRRFGEQQSAKLHIVSRALVPLLGARNCEFVVFRGGEGLRDQIAVVVGTPDPDEPVLVRLHSACLTGDLFGSLRCDCGDQLRSTVTAMAEAGGGVLLYLDQEGRGNGIANKIRAYRLQSEGFDTFAADATLGFGLDSRQFEFAAEMLRQLDYTRVILLTNNPQKIEALRRSGLAVMDVERIYGRRGADNLRYLVAKRDHAGHLLGLDELVPHAPSTSA